MDSSSSSLSLLSLPPDLQQEIICRTPAEALIRSKSMSKKWNALISKEIVIYKHLDHSSERFIRTVDTVNVIDPVTQTRTTSPVPDEFQDPNKIVILLHCDGLLLCRRRDWHIEGFEPEEPRRPQLAIWNPVFRKVKWIMPSDCSGRHNTFGFGYKTRGDYLILKFPNIKFKYVDGENPVELYEVKNESWRSLDRVKVDWVVDSSCNGVAVLGNMYWLAEKKKRKSYIVGFDFTVERFKDVCSCPPPSSGGDHLSCFGKDRLSLLQQDKGSKKMEVWVSNSLNSASVSFTKHLSVASPDLPTLKPLTYTSNPAYCFVKPKIMVAWCEGVEEVEGETYCTYTLYRIDDHGVRSINETGRHSENIPWVPCFCGHVYVPSLVPFSR